MNNWCHQLHIAVFVDCRKHWWLVCDTRVFWRVSCCLQAAGTLVIWRVRRVWWSWAGSWLFWRFWSWLCSSRWRVAPCSGTLTSTPPSVCTDPSPSARSCWSTHWPRTCTTGWVMGQNTHYWHMSSSAIMTAETLFYDFSCFTPN